MNNWTVARGVTRGEEKRGEGDAGELTLRVGGLTGFFIINRQSF